MVIVVVIVVVILVCVGDASSWVNSLENGGKNVALLDRQGGWGLTTIYE